MARAQADRENMARGWAERRAQRGLPGEKLCRQCGMTKPVNRINWHYRKRRSAVTGEAYEYVSSPCKECRHKKQAQIDRARKARNPERYRRIQRAASRRQRQRQRAASPPLLLGPFVEWLTEWQSLTGVNNEELSRRVHLLDPDTFVAKDVARRLRVYRSGAQKSGSMELIDAVFVAAGMPELMYVLYGDDGEQVAVSAA